MSRADTHSGRPGRPWRRLVTALPVLLATAVPPASAEEAPEAPADSSWTESRFQIHGFLSQAYAASDGNQILGIDEDGTNQYRTAALQMRYELTERDSFAIQLAHEGLGESPLEELNEDVELDWVFYHRRLGDRTEIKVGKVPIPQGIYNQILDVGTILPFYRPPSTLYGEIAFASETVDGAVLSHGLFGASDWPVDLDLYYGGWEMIETLGTGIGTATVEDAVGLQVWVRPPVSGLRVGLAAKQFLASDGLLRPPGVQERWRSWQGSVEWIVPRLVVRGEYTYVESEASEYTAYYAQAGIRLTSELTLNLQAEWADLTVAAPGLAVDVPFDRDRALGLAYAFSSGLVAKLELHRNEGYRTEDPAPDLFGPPDETTYGIASLSVSF